ncbi:MAG TPA: CPBP family intramembrane glutamic endopeptidase [Actinomycetota bacterium]|nr:CPBP family intramembrane glutamic endopeptidase [Actinomycetota bacterium]
MRERQGVRSWEAPLAVAGGTLALVARVPSPFAVAVTAAVGAVGGLVAVRSTDVLAGARLRWLVAVALGSLPFLVASTLLMSNPLPRAAWVAIAASVVAAIAEEVFFRRLVYGWLERWGTAVAIAGSAALFAAIHVPVYGLGVLPLDFAAGLIFGWQRRATGSWTAPAATHVFANLLASL